MSRTKKKVATASMIPEIKWETQEEAHAAIVAEGATHRKDIGSQAHPMVTYYRPSPTYKGHYGYTVLSRYADGMFRHGPWFLAPDGLDANAARISDHEATAPHAA